MDSAASSKLSNYGFESSDTRFDPAEKEKFENLYSKTVDRRATRWNTVNFEENPRNSKMKRFVRKGIPPAMRAKYWMVASGMDKAMRDNPGRFRQLLDQSISKDLINAIDTDVPRTFPENKFFASNGNKEQDMLNEGLRKVLRAFAAAMEDIGYCQGLNFVAAVILLVVKDAEKSFWLLEHLIKNVVPSGYYKPSMKELKRDCDVLSCLVKEKLPKLSERLDNEGISFVVICTKWFICLYCDTLPFETSLRVLDCLFYEGDKILFRVGLTLLQMNAKELEKNCQTFPQLLTAIQKMVQDNQTLFCHEFMQRVFSAPGSLSRKKIQKLRVECEERIDQTDANTP